MNKEQFNIIYQAQDKIMQERELEYNETEERELSEKEMELSEREMGERELSEREMGKREESDRELQDELPPLIDQKEGLSWRNRFFVLVGACIAILIIIPNDYRQICIQKEYKCQSVRDEVLNYIMGSYTLDNEVRVMLDIAAQMEKLTNTSITKSEEEYKEIYRNLFQSGKCSNYIFGPKYLYKYLQLQQYYTKTNQQRSSFAKMSEIFCGQPLKISSKGPGVESCQFNFSSIPLDTSNKTFQEQNATIYHSSSIGRSVSGALQFLDQLVQSMRNDPDLKDLSIQIISASAWRKNQGLSQKVKETFIQKCRETNCTVLSDQEMNQLINIIHGSSIEEEAIHSSKKQTFNVFKNIFNEVIKTDIEQTSMNYDTHIHTQIIGEKIRQGKKVVIVYDTLNQEYVRSMKSSLNQNYQKSVGTVQMKWSSTSSQSDCRQSCSQRTVSNNDNDKKPTYNELFEKQISRFKLVVADNLKNAFKTIQKPKGFIGKGLITVEMTWDEKPDVDLHIFEPNGVHIYYRNKQGEIGYLDVDDTSSYGPEHYFSNISNIQAGQYVFKANYYNGNGNSHVNVRINAGEFFILKNFVTEARSMGSRGDQNPPYFICKVVVTYNETTKNYSFRIIDKQ